MAKVMKTQICPEKGAHPQTVTHLNLIQGSGIEGDWHQGRGKRDVCILRKEILDWMESQPRQGFCFPKQKANLLIEGLDDNAFHPGDRLCFREVVLEVSDFPKHCFPEQCDYAKQGIPCKLRQEWQMAKILTSGIIYSGEEVTVNKHP